MSSEELEKLVSHYNDPDLTDRERIRLDQMLEDNPDLDDVLGQYKRLDRALAQLPDGLEKVDFERFSRRVSEAVAGAQAPRPATISIRRYLAPLIAAAAIIIVALPLFLFLDHPPTPPVGDFVAVVQLAQPQTLFDQAVVKNIGVIIPPEFAGPEEFTSSEDTIGGVVCSVAPASKPERTDQFKATSLPGIFNIFIDGSP